jgi:hypothetical protein
MIHFLKWHPRKQVLLIKFKKIKLCFFFLFLQVGLLNVDGYYNSLLSFIDKAVDEDFITPAARNIIVSAQTAHELMCKLEVHFIIFWIHSLIIFVHLAHLQYHGVLHSNGQIRWQPDNLSRPFLFTRNMFPSILGPS